ncbi:MAG: hypothetical protein E6J87_16450, partial [Deltaproteobacteria bacterium]
MSEEAPPYGSGWKPLSLFHFTLSVASLERSIEFYTAVGFRVLRNNADVIWPDYVAPQFGLERAQGRGALLAIGDGELHTRLDLIQWLEPAARFPDTPTATTAPRIIAIRVENVRAAYRDLCARGIVLPRSRSDDRRADRVHAGRAGQPDRFACASIPVHLTAATERHRRESDRERDRGPFELQDRRLGTHPDTHRGAEQRHGPSARHALPSDAALAQTRHGEAGGEVLRGNRHVRDADQRPVVERRHERDRDRRG